MGVRVLLEVLTPIVCPCIAQLTLSSGWIFLGVTVVVATLLLMARPLGTTDVSKGGHRARRYHSNDDCAHQRHPAGIACQVGIWTPMRNALRLQSDGTATDIDICRPKIPIAPADPGASLPALSFPGGFRTPALGPHGQLRDGLVSENRHTSGRPLQHLHTLGSSVRTPNREDDPKAVKECYEVAN